MLWQKRGVKPGQIPVGSARPHGKISPATFDEKLALGYLRRQVGRYSRIDTNESRSSLESAPTLTSASDYPEHAIIHAEARLTDLLARRGERAASKPQGR